MKFATDRSAASTSFQASTSSAYGGLMSQGYVPPGQFEDLLNLIRQASAAAERAMQAAKYAEMASSAAGAAGQQAVVRAMHLASAPGAPVGAPFAPGAPEPGPALGLACAPEPGLGAALWAATARAGGPPCSGAALLPTGRRGVCGFLDVKGLAGRMETDSTPAASL
mmetsp:Transcript_113078/g.314746  ORF Transcript_113078/g.314746 Transcript_113078/m.314746 type:complete len:167 (-) Transcript_113078:29-529(-)